MADIHDYAAVCLGAFFGVLLRVLCRVIYDLLYGQDIHAISPLVINTLAGPLFKDIYSNILGCIGIGIVSRFKQSKFLSKYPRWYAHIATGAMGSLTTFSSWQGESSMKFWLPGSRVIDGFMALLIGFCTAYVSLIFGMHFGNSIIYCITRDETREEDELRGSLSDQEVDAEREVNEAQQLRTANLTLKWINWTFLIALSTVWIALSAVLKSDQFRSIPLGCIGGAAGAVTRYVVSNWFNPRRRHFLTGTFICNIFGTLIYIAVVTALRVTHSSLNTIDITSGILLLGFTGGLTTVSSWMLELHSLPTSRSWIYGIATLLTTQILMLPFNGMYYKVSAAL